MMKNNQFLNNYLPENAISLSLNINGPGGSGIAQSCDLSKSSV